MKNENIQHSNIEHILVSISKKVNRTINQEIKNEIQHTDLSQKQIDVLLYIHAFTNVTPSNIALECDCSKSQITRYINSLDLHGYITRIYDASNRRSYRLELSPKGLNLIGEIAPILSKLPKSLMLELSQEETKALMHFLQNFPGAK